jgi:hypothetical protein
VKHTQIDCQQDAVVLLPGGRKAKLVPADDAGVFRLQVDDFAHLAKAGASHDAISLARTIARLWHASGVDLRSRQASADSGGGGCFEDRVREGPLRRANLLIGFAGKYAFAVRAVVIYDEMGHQLLRDCVAGLNKILDTAGGYLLDE